MTAELTEKNKEVVRRPVEDVINEWRIDELAGIFTAGAAARARDDFASFREAFPDWQMELLEMVAEDDTVVARFVCHGTHDGAWRGDAPTGNLGSKVSQRAKRELPRARKRSLAQMHRRGRP